MVSPEKVLKAKDIIILRKPISGGSYSS